MLGGIVLVFAMAMVWGLPSFDPPSGEPVVAMSAGPISARGPQYDDAETGAAPPPPPPIEQKLGLWSVNLVLEAGNTLLAALTKTGISYNEAYGASQNLKTVFDLRTLKAGQTITLTLRPDDDEKNALHLNSLAMVAEPDRINPHRTSPASDKSNCQRLKRGRVLSRHGRTIPTVSVAEFCTVNYTRSTRPPARGGRCGLRAPAC